MFAVFGLRWEELLVLAVIAVLLTLPVIIVLVVLFALRRPGGRPSRSDEVAELRAEIERLREELEQARRGQG
jgi:hypothetical protein